MPIEATYRDPIMVGELPTGRLFMVSGKVWYKGGEWAERPAVGRCCLCSPVTTERDRVGGSQWFFAKALVHPVSLKTS